VPADYRELVGALYQDPGNVRSTDTTRGNPNQSMIRFDLRFCHCFETNISWAIKDCGSHCFWISIFLLRFTEDLRSIAGKKSAEIEWADICRCHRCRPGLNKGRDRSFRGDLPSSLNGHVA
jgi:hypothetical protein